MRIQVQVSKVEKVIIGTVSSLIVAVVLTVANWVSWVTVAAAGAERDHGAYTELEGKVEVIEHVVIENGVKLEHQSQSLNEIKSILRDG